MTEITIPDKLSDEIQCLINDGFVQRQFGYRSVEDFIIRSVENQLEADKDIAMITV